MDKSFCFDLDKALRYLYSRQYSLEFATEDPHRCVYTRSLKAHLRFKGLTILFDPFNGWREEKRPMLANDAYLNYLLWQLSDDGYVQSHAKSYKPYVEHLVLTNRGRLFIESGGYRGRSRREWWDSARSRATTILTAINAIVIIWLTWRAAKSADDDRLKDEQIIQMGMEKVNLEKKVSALELDLRERLFNERHQRDSLP